MMNTVNPESPLGTETDRLLLRQWRATDRDPFALMNDCDRVMRYFPRHYSREQSDQFIDYNARSLRERGWGNLAVEIRHSGRFAGFVGLSKPSDWHPCASRFEIGWRLAHEFRGAGYATEAATAIVTACFDSLGIEEIVSYTAECNLPSINVMQKPGMRLEGHFDHPRIPADSELCKHVCYVLHRERRQVTLE